MTVRTAIGRWPALLALCAGLGLLPGACAPAGLAVGAGATAGVASAQERGFKGTLNDQAIRLEINHLWFQENVSLYSKVNLQVQEGRVLLTGNVPDPDTRVNAVRLAWQAKGVREVINEIEIDDASSLSDAARDAWISTKLRARLLADREVDAINYSIETVNRSVYLMGIAQNQAELDRVIDHARDTAYVRRVVSYVRLKAAPGAAS
ncbi:MAG: BON domain-containing protein [Kiloniellaceae bacterium]